MFEGAVTICPSPWLLLVRERSALATIIVSRRVVCDSVCHSVILSAARSNYFYDFHETWSRCVEYTSKCKGAGGYT